jgi:hypothetical protein
LLQLVVLCACPPLLLFETFCFCPMYSQLTLAMYSQLTLAIYRSAAIMRTSIPHVRISCSPSKVCSSLLSLSRGLCFLSAPAHASLLSLPHLQSMRHEYHQARGGTAAVRAYHFPLHSSSAWLRMQTTNQRNLSTTTTTNETPKRSNHSDARTSVKQLHPRFVQAHRSHIYSLRYKGTLHLIDLAGSERLSKTGASGAQVRR